MVNGSGPMRRAGRIGPIGKFPVSSPTALMPMPSPHSAPESAKPGLPIQLVPARFPFAAASADKANMPATARRSRLPQDRSAHLSIQAHAPPSAPMRRLLNDTNGTKGRAHGTGPCRSGVFDPSAILRRHSYRTVLPDLPLKQDVFFRPYLHPKNDAHHLATTE